MRSERLVTGLLLALAAFWVGSSFWVRGAGVPDWWLPVALAAGIAAGWFCQPRTAAPASERAPRWAALALTLLVAIAFAAVAYGAVATPSRHWDGAASFDAKVFWLVQAPTLQQPFFATDGVFHHGPDYPLLQPLLVAMAERLAPGWGRLALPLLYLLLVGIVIAGLRRSGATPLLRLAIAGSVALTPALLTSGAGAVDSGYSELALLLTTTTIAAGLLNGSALWFALGIGLAIVTKPEGVVYAAAATAVAFVRGDGRMLAAGVLGLVFALATWAPVRAMLLHLEPSPNNWLALAVLALATWALFTLTRRLPRPAAVRWTLVIALPLALLAALPVIAPQFAPESAIGVYMRQAARWHEGLANLPAYLAGVVEYGVLRMRLGLAFVMPLATLLVLRTRRAAVATGGLGTLLVFGLMSTALPFVLSPEPDLQHHLRSSLPRLLLHWIGPAWLLTAALLKGLGDAKSANGFGSRAA